MKKGRIKYLAGLSILLLAGFTSVLSARAQTPEIISAEELKEVRQAGTYLVYMKADGSSLENLVKVTVTFPYTIINKTVGEGIDGSDFEYKDEVIEEIPLDELIEKANVYAWNLDDGSSVPITKAEVEGKQGEVVQVAFSTAKGTTITIQAVSGSVSLFERKDFMYTYPTDKEMPYGWSVDYSLFFSVLFLVLVVCPLLLTWLIYGIIDRKIVEFGSLMEIEQLNT